MRPLVIFYTAVLTKTGGGQYALSLLGAELRARGYDVVVLTREPFDPTHRYARLLAERGIPVRVLPRFHELRLARPLEILAAMLLAIPAAIARRRSLRAAWELARSFFRVQHAHLERRYIARQLSRIAAGRGRVLLQVWGP